MSVRVRTNRGTGSANLGSRSGGRETIREEKGLEGGGGRVTRIVAHAEPCLEPQRPSFMKESVQDKSGINDLATLVVRQ